MQLPRLTYTGYCRACLRLGCAEVDCITAWNRLAWQPCPCCHGSGYTDIDTGADNACTRCDACTEGLIEGPADLDDDPVVCAGQPWPGKICAPGWL